MKTVVEFHDPVNGFPPVILRVPNHNARLSARKLVARVPGSWARVIRDGETWTEYHKTPGTVPDGVTKTKDIQKG